MMQVPLFSAVHRAATGMLLYALGFSLLAAEAPEPPRAFVDTRYVQPSGEVIRVPDGGDLQKAINRARPGQVIELEAGAVYVGPFSLPDKAGEDWIIIRGSATDRLSPPGTRIDIAQSDLMPKLVAHSRPVIDAEDGAHHYRFIGLEIHPGSREDASFFDTLRGLASRESRIGSEGLFVTNLVDLGSGARSMEDFPHHIIFDRCWLHGDPQIGTRRGVAMNSRYTAVIDSHLSDFMEVGADSQAIAGWNGPGPFKIVNNYLEGAGENVMFGGGTPRMESLVPSDIEIRGNHFYKPLSWRIDHPTYQGTPWSVKNLFELKNARRVIIDGNIFEHSWPHAQNGFAILFTVRNEGGDAPWAVIEDVRFTNNLLRGIGSGINIMGFDENGLPSGRTSRIEIRNNLFIEIGGSWGRGRLLQMLDGTSDIVFADNTAFNPGNMMMAEGRPHQAFVFRDNVVMRGAYGFAGSGFGDGHPTLKEYFPDADFTGNVIIEGSPFDYPGENEFPLTPQRAGFRNYENGDYRLGDGKETPGVDFEALCAALPSTQGLPFCRHP